jgi:hypothetical protein
MRVVANEHSLPRLHLIGTLLIVSVLTLALGVFFSWRTTLEQRQGLERVAQAAVDQQQKLLQAEMDSAVSFIDYTRQRTEAIVRKSLREQVDGAMQVVQAIYQREAVRRPKKEVQQLIAEALRQVRFFDGRGYFFIDDMSGQVVLMPASPTAEGKPWKDVQDDTGHYIIRGLLEAAKLPDGEGFSAYRYYPPGSRTEMTDKLAYVRYFAPYDWLIGTGDYLFKWEQQQQREVLERLRAVRFAQSGRISVLDSKGQVLLAHTPAGLNGGTVTQNTPAFAAVQTRMIDTAQHGGGLMSYDWVDANAQAVQKTALVRLVQPWGWVLIVNVENSELQAAVHHELTQERAQQPGFWLALLLPLLAAWAVGLGASWGFSRWSAKLFAHYHQSMLEHTRALAESEGRFRALFDNAGAGIVRVAPNGLVVQANRCFAQMLGYEPGQIESQGLSVTDFTDPAGVQADVQRLNTLLQSDANSDEWGKVLPPHRRQLGVGASGGAGGARRPAAAHVPDCGGARHHRAAPGPRPAATGRQCVQPRPRGHHDHRDGRAHHRRERVLQPHYRLHPP